MGTPLRYPLPVKLSLLLTACSLLLAFAATDHASAYAKPAGGHWKFENLFDDTRNGRLVLSRNGSRVLGLAIVPGREKFSTCGRKPIFLAVRPKIRRFRMFNGRYAVAGVRAGLLAQKPYVFRRGKHRFRAKLMLIWEDDGKLMGTGEFERGQCRLDFFARKRG